MPVRIPSEIDRNNLGPFEPRAVLEADQTLSLATRGGLKQFFRNTLDTAQGSLPIDPARGLITALAEYEEQYPLISASPFRYAATPDLPELNSERTVARTLVSARDNMRYMLDRFDPRMFGADLSLLRKDRALQWRAPLDDSYEIRVRGGSGAGTFSLDFGLGLYDAERPWHYNELWRSGLDSMATTEGIGTRFIRTGSGIKPDDEHKRQAFSRFRKTYAMLPQRLLGLVGLYAMRELNPDYAVALTTPGAQELSTLRKSSGDCDYTGIFSNIGFQPSRDENWSVLFDFKEGFFDALHRARIRRTEADTLHLAVNALNHMTAIKATGQPLEAEPPFTFCADSSKHALEREIQAHIRRPHH